ncbi:MAG: hypothetical protein IJ417_02945 [Bacteroidaceae bacterium]|nr:hypothetical protein [Bacteroidaceae bacterium]
MNKENIESLCLEKAEALLKKYFGNLIKEAALDCPETIGDYDMELPLRVENEYREFLTELWKEISPCDKRTIDDLLDKKHFRNMMTEDDQEGLAEAYRNAKHRTLWERITKTNHKDVTYYKGLLEEYTRELLFCIRLDFLEEVRGKEIQAF